MDDYPATEPIPDLVNAQHVTLVEFLTDNAEMRKAARHALAQGLFAGGGAVLGGILMGPVGGLVGGIAGSVVGFFQSDDYDGVVQQILLLEGAHKQALMTEVGQVLTAAGATAQQFESTDAFQAALVQFASQRSVRDQVWRACMHAIESENE